LPLGKPTRVIGSCLPAIAMNFTIVPQRRWAGGMTIHVSWLAAI
jgi:hypothetical protein